MTADLKPCELLPCPFCLGSAKSNRHVRQISPILHMAWCVNSECAMFEHYTDLDKWNRRAIPVTITPSAQPAEAMRLLGEARSSVQYEHDMCDHTETRLEIADRLKRIDALLGGTK